METTLYPNPRAEAAEDDWIEIRFEVEEALHGFRVDRFLQARVRRLSRTRIQSIIGCGQLRVEGGPVISRASTRVRVGDRLILRRPAPEEPEVPMRYEALYRDDVLMVIDKPSGLPVHPTARYHRHTLTALMRTRLGPEHGWQMAHRIDRETSGLLAFARGAAVRSRRQPPSPAGVLKRSFARREVHKEYLAIARGRVEQPRSLEQPLGFDPDSTIGIKMGAVELAAGGSEASTDVVPLAHATFRGEPITLLRCVPRTGRQHQIRIHLALAGHALLGDKLYGVDERLFREMADGLLTMDEVSEAVGLSRQALHAHVLELPHPSTGERMRFEAPWPPMLADIIALPQASG